MAIQVKFCDCRRIRLLFNMNVDMALSACKSSYNAEIINAIGRCGIQYNRPVDATEWEKIKLCLGKITCMAGKEILCVPGYIARRHTIECQSAIHTKHQQISRLTNKVRYFKFKRQVPPFMAAKRMTIQPHFCQVVHRAEAQDDSFSLSSPRADQIQSDTRPVPGSRVPASNWSFQLDGTAIGRPAGTPLCQPEASPASSGSNRKCQ